MLDIFNKVKKFIAKTNKGLKPYKRNALIALTAILAIALSQLTLLWRPIVGIYINAMVLALLMWMAVLKTKLRQLCISVAIIPLCTMVVLALPQSSIFAQEVVFYSALLVLGYAYRFLFTLDYPMKYTKLSLKGYIYSLALMIIVGEVLGLLGYAMLRHHYIFDHESLPLLAVTVGVFGLIEEVVFRGLIQQSATKIMHPLLAGILSTFLFTLMSINTQTYLAPVYSLILGATLATVYARKQNLILTGTINALAKLTYVALMASFVFR